ncbi:DUF3108 domain-containing protein [Methylobacillus gramineus]|uniref:DUF3108 domain-containing protein n=1 Tax=Methylobacillus gramineus TaxID=755169 RepID=UPI001D000E42|nr:DUF3108 domain-containing protein [Methylobacillus gramineus]MCB5185588.1 DUF3108 domain-containing protein [Methylobacillus gramineus]
MNRFARAKTILSRLPYGGFVLALVLSLLVHLLFFSGEYWQLPSLDFAKEQSERQWVHLQAIAPSKPVSSSKQPSKPKPAPAAKTQPAPLPQPETPVETTAPAVTEPTEPVAAVNETQPIEDQQPEAETAVAMEADNASDEAGLAHDVPAFSYVDTEFEVLRGIDGSKVGVTHISYKVLDGQRYVLTSITEPKGLASLVVAGKLLQISEGAVTEQGLQPDHFSYQFGKSASKLQEARFDWVNAKLSLATAKGVKVVDLPPATQDLLSFMYQFVFVPPLEQLQLNVTNGKKLSMYVYSFDGEETLKTEAGMINTLHLVKTGQEGSEKTELWLAVDYHYLPVKMRKTEEDGSVIEQLVVRISTDLLK